MLRHAGVRYCRAEVPAVCAARRTPGVCLHLVKLQNDSVFRTTLPRVVFFLEAPFVLRPRETPCKKKGT